MEESAYTTYDKFGRMFCKEHQRDYCHECGFDYRDQNQMVEEEQGLRQKRTQLEEAAESWALFVLSLRGLERMHPRPHEELFRENRKLLREYEEKLENLERAGEDVESAKQKAMKEKGMAAAVEREAIMRERARQNPGQQSQFWWCGAESQRIYEKVAQAPKAKSFRADMFTCAFCGKTDTEKLPSCGRCKMISYCSKQCQTSHWKAHKKECVKREVDPKALKLTWEQVEAHQGAPVTGRTLEVRAMVDDKSTTRQVFYCKDRVGAIRPIAAYTNNGQIPGLTAGSTLLWKNPRYYHFVNGHSGGRIEEEDVVNITVKN